MKGKVRIINHTADIGIEVLGNTIEEIFLNSAIGLYKIMEIEYDGEEGFLEISLYADQIEELLVKFLNELIYLIETKKVGGEIKSLSIIEKNGEYSLNTILKTKRVKKRNKEIKAATYHNLRIEETEKGFKTTIIFDL